MRRSRNPPSGLEPTTLRTDLEFVGSEPTWSGRKDELSIVERPSHSATPCHVDNGFGRDTLRFMSTAVISDTLFPMPEPVAPAEMSLQERMDEFTRIAKGKEGLIPVTAAADLLQISRQRVYELINSGRLERIHYCGVAFITGRSIKDWNEAEKGLPGRGKKKLGRFKSIVIGAKVGLGIGTAVTAD